MTDTPLTDAVWEDVTQNILEHARDLERHNSALIGEVKRFKAKLAEATALITRVRNGPGCKLPFDLYNDIQYFLNTP